MKQVIIELLKKSLEEEKIKLTEQEIENILETPPSQELGDYAFPCFSLAEKLQQPPHEIVLQLRQNIGNPPIGISDIQTRGPYLNFFVDRKILAFELIKEIKLKKDKFGKIKNTGKRTMVEFPSPNTNKPLHLGHLRNMAIGESVSRILEFNGEKVIRANLNNDRGIHICKSMAAYKLYGKNKKPTKKIKPDHFVGKFYVMFNEHSKKNEKLEIESHRMLQRWEQGDKETIELWKKMNKWALDGFQETYEKFGIKPDIEFFESKIYQKGKEIIQQGLKDKIFKKKRGGAIGINLKKEKLGEKILLRSDGTSVYITQDLYLAKHKFEKYNIDKSIYVVANEQNYHFDVLFTILKKLGFEKRDMYHLSYGEVFLPGWKKIKSREGTEGITIDETISKIQELVKKELSSREKLSKTELEKRSLTIALAAIKYMILQVDMKKNMIFDPQASINFEGNTGPYILYAYARASSILKKIKNPLPPKQFEELEEKEIELIKKISQYNQTIQKAYETLNPSLIANYSYQLAQTFNEFYHACPVKDSEKENFRINLVESFRQVLKNSLNLIGIDVLEKM